MSDKSAILEHVINTAKNAGSDACDVLLYDSTSISVSRRMGKPEGLERSESTGLSLRVFVGKGSATVSSSDISKQALQEAIERAVAMAKLAPQDEFAGIAPQELLAKQIIDLDLYDKNEPDTTWMQQQCQIAEDAALAVKGVSNSEGADASYGSYNFALATSNGFFGSYNASNSS
ncbi:MAG: DNA gyrase modulator, partial [Pseudomonadota bacterium]